MSILYNYEWSMPFPQGHTNTVFASRHNFKMNGKTGATATLQGGWEFLRRGGYKAITIPHTPADPGMGTTWPAYDPKYMRLCEIFQSCRGSYEHDGCPRQHVNATNKQGFYWLALEKGYKLGIICSSDHGYGAAYACVYAQGQHARRRLAGAVRPPHVRLDDVRPGRWTSAAASTGWARNSRPTQPPPIDVYVRGSAPIRSSRSSAARRCCTPMGSVEKPHRHGGARAELDATPSGRSRPASSGTTSA